MESQNQNMKHILIVPDKFKGSLTSLQAAQAIRKGLERRYADASAAAFPLAGHAGGAVCSQGAGGGLQFQIVEIADGGDGSLDVVAGRVTSPQKVSVQVHDPLFREVTSQILLYGGGAGGGIFQGRADFEANSCPEFCGDAFRADLEADSRSNLRNSTERADSSHDSRQELVGQEKGAENEPFSRPESHLDSCHEQRYLSSQTQSQKNASLCAFIEMAKISGLAISMKAHKEAFFCAPS